MDEDGFSGSEEAAKRQLQVQMAAGFLTREEC